MPPSGAPDPMAMLEGIATAPPPSTNPLLNKFSTLDAGGGAAASAGDDFRASVAEAASNAARKERRLA